jgi:hypothetical protein
MQDLNDNIPALKIELMDDGKGEALILLTQDDYGDAYSVSLHPIHLRYLAEKMGLIETSDPTAHKTIAKLTRRLHLLRDRVEHLANSLATNPNGCQQDYARATADIANEFCAELDDTEQPCNTANTKAVMPAELQSSLI